MKKVLIIGAGAQGNVISGVLSKAEDVGLITLGDIDIERAREVSRAVHPGKIVPEKIDASDVESMSALMKNGAYDLIVNATLVCFNRAILAATVSAGANYLDMASAEWLEPSTETTVQEQFIVEQLEWAKDFEDAGKTGLILAGCDSGMTNIMSREAADHLDEIDYIGIKDFGIVECDIPVALWSMETYIEDSAARSIYWEDGEYKTAEPFAGAEIYDFPPPLNRKGKVVYHLHEEPVTIPKFIGKPVKYCDFKIGDADIDMWEFMINGLGLMDPTPVEVNGIKVSPRDVFMKQLPKTLSPNECIKLIKEKRLNSQCMVVVDVKGKKGDDNLHIKLWSDGPDSAKACGMIPGTNDISWATSVPASILSLMILRGQIRRKGVFPCETLDAREREIFFDGIRNWEINIHKQINCIK